MFLRNIQLALYCLIGCTLYAQNGLEGVVVERFYVTDKSDNYDTLHNGFVPVKSVVYRIYLDLKPDYTFQAAYGSPGHTLYFESTEPFYNHIEFGNASPAFIPEHTLSKSLVSIDSWLTASCAAENHLAIPVALDDTTTDVHIRFPAALKDAQAKNAFPFRDGMMRTTQALPQITFYNMDDAKRNIHTAQGIHRIVIENGAWACMGKGVYGLNPKEENLVLIAQLTTRGKLSFGLNVMIGTPDGKSERYVYQNPGQDEAQLNSLLRKASKKYNKEIKIAK
jgi:hypothetical protein